MSKKKEYTEVEICPSCGNKSPLELKGTHSDLKEEFFDNSPSVEFGYTYQFCNCPACSELVIRRYYWHDMMDDGDFEVIYEIIFPRGQKSPKGLPSSIQKAYDAAISVRKVDPNAYSVLLGRVLEFICEDREAVGRTLHNKLKDLSAKGEIPKKLTKVAHGLRQLRNVGAHASLGELTTKEIPVLDNLTTAIIEYIYTAPLLAEEAEKAFIKLKRRKSKK